MQYLSFTVVTELISLFLGVIFLIRDKSIFWRILLLYVFLSAGTELLGKFCARAYHTNLLVYNIFIFIEISFISYGFYVFLKEYADIKKLIFSVYLATLVIYIGYFIFYGINSYNILTVSVISVVFVIYALMYFYLLLKDENYVNLKFHPAFWWIGGTLIFYFGGTLANFFDDIIRQNSFGKSSNRLFIYNTLNVFLHGFWIYAYICRARQRKIFQ